MKTKKNYISRILSAAAMAIIMAVPASAAGLQESTIVTGTTKLLTDAMTVLTILCPTIGGIAAVIFAIRRSMTDQQDGKMWQNRMVTAIICGVGGGLITGIIALVSSYYTAG